MGKHKGKRGRSARLARKGICNAEAEEVVKAPHSFVINRGKLGKNANDLLLNFRKLMEPYTASQLKVQKQNVLKDFVHIAGPLNVSHLVIFTKSPNAMYLRIAKLPHGPTLTFQIKEYALVRDIISSQRKSLVYEKLFEHHPLLVLNNFSGDGMHFKLMTTTFQNMFPSINVNKTNLNTIRRTLLLNYNADKTIELRQYAVKIVPTGMSKAVKKLIQSKVPDLGHYQDIGDFLSKPGNLSESEAEIDTPANTVVLPQPISSRGNITSEKSAVRLFELGPRMKLQLVKIEDGLMGGEVLFHEFITKSPKEVKAIKEKIKAKKLLKEQRKAQQRKNVERKKASAEKETENASGDERDEDLEWYRKEVGEDPDEGVLPMAKKRKIFADHRPKKRVKFSEDSKKHRPSEKPFVKRNMKFSKKINEYKTNSAKSNTKRNFKSSGRSTGMASKHKTKKYSKQKRK